MAVICGALLSNQWHRLSTGRICLCNSKAKYVNQDGIPSCGRHKNMSRNIDSEPFISCGALLSNQEHRLFTRQACLCESKAKYVNQDGIPSCGTHKNKSRIVAECSICMSGCIAVETCVTACKHMFHTKCIQQWGDQQWGTTCNVSCSLCRCSLLV